MSGRMDSEPATWMDAEVDGHTVRFWIGVGVAIAVITLGIGAWWVWGLGRGMPMEEMEGMPHTDVRLPPVTGFYAGEEIFFVHPEASDPEVAEVLTEMMAGSPVLVVPELGESPAETTDEVYVFANGVEGMGPFGFQPDVFPSGPGDADYTPLRTVVFVRWRTESEARELRSSEEVLGAAEAGDVELEASDVVVNMPFLTWPQGRR